VIQSKGEQGGTMNQCVMKKCEVLLLVKAERTAQAKLLTKKYEQKK